MRKFTKERAEYILRKRMPETREVLDALPPDVDPEVVAESALLSVGHTWSFARGFKKLPAEPVRAAMRRMQAQTTPLGIFLREAVPLDLDDDEITAAWAGALTALLDMETSYAWGSKQRRAKLQGVAKNSRFVAALQAVAVGCEKPPLDMLAVLTIDASEASIDALMPHFVRATELKDGGARPLPQTEDARVGHAGDPDDDRRRRGDVRRARRRLSPARDRGAHRSRRAEGLLVRRFLPVHRTRPGTGLGNCTPPEVPAYLARAAATLSVRWRDPYISGSMRGASRDRLRTWLLGGA